jgi:hypothetical protein
MGGEVGASAFLPPVASTAPPMVTVRVAMASYGGVLVSPNSSRPKTSPGVMRGLRASSFSPGGRTMCDPTWRPMMLYIATIFAMLRVRLAVEWRIKSQWMGVRESRWVRFSYAESFADGVAAAGA